MAETKRSLIAHYVDSTPSATAETYELIGEGVSSAQMAMNPQESTEHYVHEDVATGFVDGYQPSMDVEQIVYPGDDLFDFIDTIRQAGPSIGSNDLTTLVEVRLYETPDTAGTSYPATQWNVAIVIVDGPGGDGGARAKIAYKFLIKGEATDGDFNTSTLAFT